MKNIQTLVRDIYDTIEEERWLTEANVEGLTGVIGRQLVQSGRQEDTRAVLRLSQMGEKCPCHLWHSVRPSSVPEALPAHTRIKFTYGHVIEALAISMAKASGHSVTGEQDELVVDGVKGHRDCVIDGCIVDVKSCNSRSFQTIKAGNVAEDMFLAAYLAQLDGYTVGSYDDDLVLVKDKAYILAIDQVLGHMCLYEHRVRPEFIRKRIRDYKDIIALSDAPECTCETVSDGSSGNVKLGTKASYNPYKHQCAERRGQRIRTFLYSDGPRFLVAVKRQPRRADGTLIPEIDRNGNFVYNNG